MMMERRNFLGWMLLAVPGGFALKAQTAQGSVRVLAQKNGKKAEEVGHVTKTDAEWKQLLTPEQYAVTRQQGTEAQFSSPLLNIHSAGIFECVCCSLSLFSSKTKFDSHTGWPSFWAPISESHINKRIDNSLSETRTEVNCARCDAHLGHVFDDGPKPTGLRYCMNGVAMKFVKAE
jgi:peptide-methionine (R)-S-oxide reductase